MQSRVPGDRTTTEAEPPTVTSSAVRPSILIVDADEAPSHSIATRLRDDGFDCRVVDSIPLAREAIQTATPHVVIVGERVRDAAAHVVTREIRAWVTAAVCIARVLPASAGDEAVEEALLLGADDVILAGLNGTGVMARTRLLARLARQTLELERERATFATERAELVRQLHHDPLTGVANRAYAIRRLGEEVGRARRYLTPLTIIAIDVDHFKRVNDTHGHAIGDGVLRGVTLMLSRVIRTVDLLGRTGGEEFLILAPSTDRAGAAVFAERLRAALAIAPMIATAGSGAHVRLNVTASFGVACFDPANAPTSLTADVLLEAADAALYAAKEAGRNRVAFATL